MRAATAAQLYFWLMYSSADSAPPSPAQAQSQGQARGSSLAPSVNALLSGMGLSGFKPGFVQRDCVWRHNITDTRKMSSDEVETLEDCLYYYLLQREATIMRGYGSGNIMSQALRQPPFQIPLRLTVNEFVVRRLETVEKYGDFHMHGDLYLSWNDSRLKWNESEWKMEFFELHDTHNIWTPEFEDIYECQGEDCDAIIEDVQVSYDGMVSARLDFHFIATCHIDYRRYPEETNDCCVYISLKSPATPIKYIVDTREKSPIHKRVVAKSEVDGPKIDPLELSHVETSAWTAEEQSVRVVPIRLLRGDRLELCVHARKRMSTLRMALRVPVTIATLLMLVSPLFGDLRTQAFVKLFILTIQSICFLYLCNITPANGFGGIKPKIYTFYEFLFFITFMSIFVTLLCLALCRLRRNVPASHNLYLGAKAINHFLCCIEPEPSVLGYQRHLEDASFDTISNYGGAQSAQNAASSRATGGGSGASSSANDPNPHSMSHDYTYEWRQIYIAMNNLFSGICFSLFCFVVFFQIV